MGTMTISEYAKTRKVNPRTAFKWLAAGKIVRAEGGGIDPTDADRRLAAWGARGAQGAGVVVSFAEARRRKEAALAGLRELELAQRRGEVDARADWTREVATAFGAVRARLQALGPTLAPVVASLSDPADCLAVIEDRVLEALAELAGEAAPPAAVAELAE